MNSVSEMIEETKKRHQIEDQKSSPVPVNEPEKNWQKCMDYLDSLPGNYMMLLQEAIEKKLQMKTLKMGKWYINTIVNWKFGYETHIEVIENENRATQKVTYYAFNNFTHSVYMRKILGGKE